MLTAVQCVVLLKCGLDFSCFVSIFTDTMPWIGSLYTEMLHYPETDPASPERHFFNDTISFFLLEWCAVRFVCVLTGQLWCVLLSYAVEIVFLFNTLQYNHPHSLRCALLIGYCMLVAVLILLELH